ncbi:MAG TPA: 2-phosphosulfolactate phosphatase [Pirellulales bacterium]|nr:2-phosphosulfolactate phosphatase [Pirellulales bacterium]
MAAHFLPTLFAPDELSGATALIIDVLRASTTICHALAAGARQVIPCLDVADARRIADDLTARGEQPLLGGERGGVRIEGFDLGNSPEEFSKETVAGRTVVFTTTNGTRAMNQCRAAARVLIGSFVNLSAVCKELVGSEARHLVCAGTRDQITREDALCAGAIADRLIAMGAVDEDGLNDQARLARDAWRQTMYGRDELDSGSIETLARTLRDSQGGRNLIALKLDRDIDAAAQMDRFRIVPELDISNWRITTAIPKGSG